ncbi:outer membrane protein [Roseicyclus persicicus]|uniref:Porin family protein n=1 Tax=Roseicyclus persicicus TaxID=2650661 RepID=A0A7X6H1Y2_9RHOB|nr:outer membrane beta-barrel protein [Roseibacterium persicicum]NKX45326.1 porin family protein [Roseibacterium persicicum]
MKRTLILTAGLAALTAAPALAGGMAEPAPAPVTIAPAPVAAGTDWTGPSVGLQLGYGDVSTSGAANLDGDDVLLGLRAYYDVDLGDFVVGGGVQYDTADIDIGGVTTLDSVTRVGVRGGVDLGSNWIYGTAGWAEARTSNAAVGDSEGWFAGVGYEVFVADTVTVGAELLHHRFEDFNLADLDAEATTAAVSVNFRF